MWVILVDPAGNVVTRDGWTVPGSDIARDDKGTVYRRTGTTGTDNKPIFKQVG